MENNYTPLEQSMLDLLEKHVAAEGEGDLETTMATMCENPHLLNVANMMGGDDCAGVRAFYANHLVGKFFPPDVQFNRISLTIGRTQIVEELVITFTHTVKVDWMLPNIEPTNKKIEICLVVIAGIKDNKITHEHVYWDQASVLVQVGLLNPADLPVVGAQSARRLVNLSAPNAG
jgi:carboxymethylenebutenolidase